MKRILITEDQADIRKLIHMTLEFEDYEIREAPDGMEGLRVAKELVLQPIEHQELTIRAVEQDGAFVSRLDARRVFHDGREQAFRHLREQRREVRGGGPQPEVGGVFEQLVHRRSTDTGEGRGFTRRAVTATRKGSSRFARPVRTRSA